MMHDREKSDPAIVAEKPTNKAGRPAAESAEPRVGAEGNASWQSTNRTQGRERVSQALERVRQVARQRKKEKFTALLHHVGVDLLGMAFFALKRDAAPGVDGLTWRNRTSFSLLTESKKDATSASSMKFTRLVPIPTANASSALCWPRFGRNQ